MAGAGVAQKSVVVPNGETKSIACPEEHTLIAAYAYRGTGLADASVQGAMQCNVSADGTASFSNTTGVDCILVCLYSKNWYEGTHPQWNIMESRRYIDVMRSEPVKKFLNVTYEKYKEHLGKYFNNGIESFFFDEPALAGKYKDSCSVINVFDEPNENLELLDTYNYSPILKDYFQQKWGYDPTPYLPYLYKQRKIVESIRRRQCVSACSSTTALPSCSRQITSNKSGIGVAQITSTRADIFGGRIACCLCFVLGQHHAKLRERANTRHRSSFRRSGSYGKLVERYEGMFFFSAILWQEPRVLRNFRLGLSKRKLGCLHCFGCGAICVRGQYVRLVLRAF